MEIRLRDRHEYLRLVESSKELTKLLTSDAPALTVASVAIIGRADADARIGSMVEMGRTYTKGKNGRMVTRRWSERNDIGAWSSTSRLEGRKTAHGRRQGPWMLSRYRWMQPKGVTSGGTPKVRARFTSNLANLLSTTTKPYSGHSPAFEMSDGMRSWGRGAVRRGRSGIWNTVERELAGSIDAAVARSERKLLKDFEL